MSNIDCPSSCSKGASTGWAVANWAGVGICALATVGTVVTGGVASVAMGAGMAGLQGFSTTMSNPRGDDSYPQQACALYAQCRGMEQNYKQLSVIMDKLKRDKKVADEDVETINDMVTSFVDMNEQLQQDKAEFITKLSTFAIIMIVGTVFLSSYINKKRT